MAHPAATAATSSTSCPRDDLRAYRHALGCFATGITVVTTRAPGGAPVGLTVNSFASVSLDPPLVSWCLERTALSLEAFEQAGSFAVNVLATDQADLVWRFAQKTHDKFSGLAFADGLDGLPLLDGVVARFECRTAARFEGGDHLIFLGEVQRYTRFAREPLIFCTGRYGSLAHD